MNIKPGGNLALWIFSRSNLKENMLITK